MMNRVKAKVLRGSTRAERIAYIKTVEGIQAEVVLSDTQTGSDHILASEVARDNNNVLIELPQEASTGYWRIWVNKSQILPE